MLQQASGRELVSSDVEALLVDCPETHGAALERLAVELAGRFILGKVGFSEAHATAAAMFHFAKARGLLRPTLENVHGAFDAGQGFSGGSSPFEDPVSV